MKRSNILAIITCITALACNDDFMERYPLDSINDDTYWRTPADIKMYANQFYQDLQPVEIFYEDDRTDNQGPSNRNTYVWDLYSVPTSGGGWGKSDWLRIRRCNYALVRIADMDKTDEILMYEAEIRFFKSFYYFEKVRRFGDVPWLDHDLQTNSEELFAPRDSRVTVVEKMLEDIDFAISYLPEVSPDDRLNKYASYALKAEVCLYEGTFRKYHNLGNYESLLQKAAEACEAVIGSGLFSVFTTGDPDNDYFNLFVQYELKGNVEGIMIQRYLQDIRMHNDVRRLAEAFTGYTKDFAESYLCKDGLPIALSPLYQGDAVFGDEFVNRDPRMRQSILTSDRPYRIFDDGSIEYKELPQFEYTQCPTSYFILKGFSPYERDRSKEQCIIDNFIFRYGKLLLDYAEAKAELGEITQEVLDQTINVLRDRVGMPHLTVDVGFVDPNWPDWEVPVTPLINEIRRERRIELAAEGSRWDDLVRWKAGKLVENVKTVLGARDPITGEYFVLYPEVERVWDDRLYLYPLPLEDLTLNNNLTQNPGWE